MMTAIYTSALISFVLSPLIFIYLNYENNVRILIFKKPYFTFLYGLIFALLAFSISYLTLKTDLLSDLFPKLKAHPFIIAIIIGAFTKHIIGLISIEIKGKEYGVKVIPQTIEKNVRKRMNDCVNGYYEEKVNKLIIVIKDKNIQDIDTIIAEILPIQIKGDVRKRHLREFKLLKTPYLKLMHLSINFGENVYKSFIRGIERE